MDLKTYFDRVVVINLRRRQDRMLSFRKELAEKGWPFAEPVVFEAIDGSKVPQPVGWNKGAGTFGCLQSHRQVLERAIMDDVKNLLVLEDDLCMRSGFLTDAEKFFGSVPDDWDQLMLGGQHCHPPRSHKPGIVKCINCQRTHAYAIRGRFLRDLYAIWCSHTSQTHCDHIMGPVQARYNVYAPDPFLFGQDRSESDISRALNPKKFWVAPTGNEPVLILECPADVVRQLRDYGVHTGYTRDLITDQDAGLIAAMAAGMVEPPLRRWIQQLQEECVSEEDVILGIWHPKVTEALVQRCWTGPVTVIRADTLEAALAQIPGAKRRALLSQKFVVLLRADKQVAGQLRDYGWHMGNWRDPITDLDNGLREWETMRPGQDRVERLREIVRTLVDEAQRRPRSVACLRLDSLTTAEIEAVTKLQVFELEASSCEDALGQLHALTASIEATSTPNEAEMNMGLAKGSR